MKQAIIYDLNRSWPIWDQPYVYMQSLGLDFEWGIVVKYWLYLGIITGAEESINTFLTSQEFKVVAQTNTSAIEFYSNAVSDIEVNGLITTKEQLIADFTSKLV